MKKVNFKPNKSMIKKWIQTLIPPYDVFFFKGYTNIYEIDTNLISIDEYLDKFSDIKYINAYEHWNIKTAARYVYVDYNNNLLSNDNYKEYIYNQQIECCRGLILDDKTLLTNYLFNNLDYKQKENLVIQYAKGIDDWFGYTNNNIQTYIKKVANKFVEEDGCNCLAVALYGATNNNLWLKDWTNENRFINQLKELNYTKTNNNYCQDDIVVFKKKNKIFHACYCVDGNLFLNKSGQSRFNPIVLLPLQNIINDWKDCEYEILTRV